MKLSEATYIYPPRPKLAIPRAETEIFTTMGWQAQLKYNDSRCMVKLRPTCIELWNRHGEMFRNYRAPADLIDQLRHLQTLFNFDPTTWQLLDGGLLDQKHTAIKNTIVLWDILVDNGNYLTGTTYAERYQRLSDTISPMESWYYTHPSHGPIEFGIKLTDNIFLAKTHQPNEIPNLWKTVETVNKPWPNPLLEGIVFKDPTGILECGYKEKNNDSWVARSRVQTGRHQF